MGESQDDSSGECMGNSLIHLRIDCQVRSRVQSEAESWCESEGESCGESWGQSWCEDGGDSQSDDGIGYGSRSQYQQSRSKYSTEAGWAWRAIGLGYEVSRAQ